MGLVAGIDAGTQSLKVLVYDPRKQAVVASASAPLALDSGADGSREQAPPTGCRPCATALPGSIPRCAHASLRWRYRASSMDSCQLTMLARCWHRQAVVRHQHLTECIQIMDAVGGFQRTITLAGNPILAGYTASKLPWTRTRRADAYARLATILLPHDYLNFVLTGQRFCELGDASGTGWLDVRTRTWSQELLRATDPDRDLAACLPPVAAPDALFDIAPEAAVRARACSGGEGGRWWRRQHDGGDRHRLRHGRAAGDEPGNLRNAVCVFRLAGDRSGWRVGGVLLVHGGWLPLICTMNCTVATERVASAFGFSSRDGDAHLRATPPGAGAW